jgi:hypothetical protein
VSEKKDKTKKQKGLINTPVSAEEQRRTAQGKKAMLAAMRKNMCIVTVSCEAAGVGRRTYYTWLEEDAEFAAAVKELEEFPLDFAEGKLFELMNGVKVLDPESGQVYKRAPCKTSLIFYLKTKGKNRGYIERSELTGKDGEKLMTETTATAIAAMPIGELEFQSKKLEKWIKENSKKPSGKK